MPFTKEEAEAKVGKQVRVRDDSFAKRGIQAGKTGEVGDSYVARTGESDGWVVTVEFPMLRGVSDKYSILISHIGKEQYERSLEEIEVPPVSTASS